MKPYVLLAGLIALSLTGFAQTDPTQRINKNLRSAGSMGLSEAAITKADSIRFSLGGGGGSGTVVAGISQTAADLRYKAIGYVPAYTDITGKPTLFSGSYSDLTAKPILFSGSYADLTGKPILFSGAYSGLTGVPTTFTPSAHTHLATDITTDATHRYVSDAQIAGWNTGTGSGFSGSYTDLTNKPTLFSGAYTDLTGKPSFSSVATSGSYADLTNKPTIPAVPNLVSAFTNDAGYTTPVAVAAAPKAYSTLTGTPTIPTAVTNNSQLSNGAGYVTQAQMTTAIAAAVAQTRQNISDSLSASKIYFGSGFAGLGTQASPLSVTATGGAVTQLAAPVITAGTPTSATIPFTIAAVTNATSYSVQSSTSSAFTSPTSFTSTSLTPTVSGLTASTAYYIRAYALAAGYTASAASNTITATTSASAAGGGSGGTAVTAASFKYLNGGTLTGNTIEASNLTTPNTTAAIEAFIASGASGYIRQTYPTSFTLSGEGSTGVITIGLGVDPHYGQSDGIASVWAQTNGQLVYQLGGGSAVYSANGILTGPAILQLRVSATNFWVEYSNDGGTTFTTAVTGTRAAGSVSSKQFISGNQRRIYNLRTQ